MKETSTQTWHEIRGKYDFRIYASDYPLYMLLEGKTEFDLGRWQEAIRRMTSDSVYRIHAPYQIVKVTTTRTEEVLG